MKKTLIIAGIVVLFMMAVVTTVLSVIFFIQATNLRHDLDTLKAQVTAETNELNSTVTPTAAATTAASTTTPTSAPTTCSVTSTSGKMVVTSPCPNTVIDSPITVTGRASVFENQFTVKIFDETGHLLSEEGVTAVGEPGTLAAFSKTYGWTPPIPPTTGTIKFYSESAMDGSEQDVVEFPIRFR